MAALTRLVSLVARVGLAVTLALLLQAVTRWSPFYAQPLVAVPALTLAGPAVLFAILAALTGRERRRTRWRGVAVVLA